MSTQPPPTPAPETGGQSGQVVRTVELRPESPLAQGRVVAPKAAVAAFGLFVVVLGLTLLWWRFRVRRKRAQAGASGGSVRPRS